MNTKLYRSNLFHLHHRARPILARLARFKKSAARAPCRVYCLPADIASPGHRTPCTARAMFITIIIFMFCPFHSRKRYVCDNASRAGPGRCAVSTRGGRRIKNRAPPPRAAPSAAVFRRARALRISRTARILGTPTTSISLCAVVACRNNNNYHGVCIIVTVIVVVTSLVAIVVVQTVVRCGRIAQINIKTFFAIIIP